MFVEFTFVTARKPNLSPSARAGEADVAVSWSVINKISLSDEIATIRYAALARI